MICLIGEQPVPNLLPIKFCRPTRVGLIYSKSSKRICDNLQRLLASRGEIRLLEVDAYNLLDAQASLERFLAERGWHSSAITFNLTGGTKPMSFAAFRVAQKLDAEIVYLQSEGGQSLLYRYRFSGGDVQLIRRETINANLEIQEYLNAHGLEPVPKGYFNNDFERAVYHALRPPVVSELCYNVTMKSLQTLELDLIIRHTNQFGVAELKTGALADKKAPIEQLNSATTREFLGTYTKRFLITDKKLLPSNVALAAAYGIKVISLCDPLTNGSLSNADKQKLTDGVIKTLLGRG